MGLIFSVLIEVFVRDLGEGGLECWVVERWFIGCLESFYELSSGFFSLGNSVCYY